MFGEKGTLAPRDLLAIIVLTTGSLGFIFLGIGMSSIGTSTLSWLGSSIIALTGFLAVFFSRWLGG